MIHSNEYVTLCLPLYKFLMHIKQLFVEMLILIMIGYTTCIVSYECNLL